MTYVLIPGAGGSAWFWSPVAAELRAVGHDVVAVELPASDERAGLPEYVDTVLRAVGERGDLTVVGHSLGGFTAAEFASRVPVRQLIFVNAMIPSPGETAGQWWANTGQREARRTNDRASGRDPDADFDDVVYFFHDVPEALVQEAARHDASESEAAFATPCTFAAYPDVPIRALAGLDDRIFPAEFQRRVARDRLGIAIEVIPGGHLAPLSHPAEVTRALLRGV